MKVTVKTNFELIENIGISEFETDGTLRMLLEHIPTKDGFNLIDPKSGDLHTTIRLRVNGQEHFTLPNKLETPLQEGDIVEIALMTAAGG